MTSPLKITVNPALPKNEIDLICMLLAGRLRDLWNGNLFCAQLAINDLLKDLSGIDALGGLKDALHGLKGGLDAFKSLSGYDTMLSKINQTLAGVGNIFSLGGLCPSPITPPFLPDLLGQLNQNLFGQAGNILNALIQASTPQMCFGGGPGGFGVNWSNIDGNLKNLKNAINGFKNDPAGFGKTMAAFEQNIKMQTHRFNSELDRLKKNLTDPLGIGERQATARKIQRANAISADYTVKDKRGIEHAGVLSPMITADIKSVLGRNDKLSLTPVTFRIDPIIDYCGNTVGYKKVIVSGDPEYIGYTPDPTHFDLNEPNPTVNPDATYIDYDFLFLDDTGEIKVQDVTGNYVDEIHLTRGKSYRIGFKLYNHSVKFYNQSTIWTSGVHYGRDPVYGVGADGPGQILIDQNSPYKSDYTVGEAYWEVLIENPTTPNTLTWNGNNGQIGNIIIDGATTLPVEDRSYDLSMAFKKGLLHYRKVTEEGQSFDRINTTGRYNVKLNLRLNDGTTYNVIYDGSTDPHKFANNITTPTSYVVYKDIDDPNYESDVNAENKIVKYITTLPDGKYLVEKLYFNIRGGTKFKETTLYLTENLNDEQVGFRPLVSIKFDSELVFMNDTRLPYNEPYSYYWSAPLGDDLTGIKDYNLFNNDEHEFELTGTDYLTLWLTDKRTVEQVGVNEFLWSSRIKIDPSDLSRSYVNTDPYLDYRHLHAKGLDGTYIDYEIVYKDNQNPDTALSSPSENSITSIVEDSRLKGAVAYTPLTLNGGVQPYEYKLINISRSGLGGGLDFNEQTGQVYGVPSIVTAQKQYEVEGKDLLGDETKRGRFTLEVKENQTSFVTKEEVDAAIAAAIANITPSSNT